MEKFVQVGFTAARDPVTREFLPAVPLYIKAEADEDGTVQEEQEFIRDIGRLFALRMKKYVDGCEKAGCPV